ncbi:MAG: hypothetical protein IRZ10_05830 [Thermoflavifilum sp.]|nr:hypothetical protein [Thermoflavifilum sp.]MCL6513924.1 hypothetical protein [Alicyclobacillus sp.]
MKTWQWATTTVLGLLVVAGVAAGTSLWFHLEPEWEVETSAAQFALDHSPLQHIEQHQVFTADGVEQVFAGQDAWGNRWTVFVSGPPWTWHAVKTGDLVSEQTVERQARGHGYEVLSCVPGWLNATLVADLHAQTQVVYEVHALDAKGQTWYALVDAKTGQWLWKYLLST